MVQLALLVLLRKQKAKLDAATDAGLEIRPWLRKSLPKVLKWVMSIDVLWSQSDQMQVGAYSIRDKACA